MAFTREKLTIITNNMKAGVIPSLWQYVSPAGDNVLAAGYFADYRLRAGDHIEILPSDLSKREIAIVTSVTDGAATAQYLVSADTLTGPGAVSVVTLVTELVTTGADALTLADGVNGQRKTIVMNTDGGDGTLTPANFGSGTTITFGDVGDAVDLLFTGGKWYVTGLFGAVVA